MMKTKITKVVNIIFVQDDKILILKRRLNYKNLNFGNGYWDLPGGSIENGETIIQGLLREVKEELSIDVDPNILQFRFHFFDFEEFPESNLLRINIFFTCQLKEPFIVKLSNEHEEFKWISLKDISMFYLFLNIIKKAIVFFYNKQNTVCIPL